MTNKEFKITNLSLATNATAYTWEKGNVQTILTNNGQTNLRVDKFNAVMSGYHTCTGCGVVGVIVGLSDAAGATPFDSFAAVTTADLQTLLNKWKDYVWLSDIRMLGTGSDENLLTHIELDAATRRLLAPGQKLWLVLIGTNCTSEAAKNMYFYQDVTIWSSPAAE